MIAVGLLSMTEAFQAYGFARPVDLILLSYGAVVGILGALCGVSLEKKTPALRREFLPYN